MFKENKNHFFVLMLSIFLAFLASSFFGYFSYKIIKPVSGFGPNLICPECLDGFFLGYLFFISFFLGVLSQKNRYSFLYLLPIVFFINPPFEFLLLSILFIAIGLLFGYGLRNLFVKYKNKQNKTRNFNNTPRKVKP